jgi:hypothetical protein
MLVTLEHKGFLVRSPGRSRGLALSTPDVDYSRIYSADLAKLVSMVEMQGALRDVELIVAASLADVHLKEALIRTALVRTSHVTMSGLPEDLPRKLGVADFLEPFRKSLTARMLRATWPGFVVDYLIFNRAAAYGAEALAERGPVFRIAMRHGRVCRRAANAAEGWLQEIVAGSRDPGEIAELESGASQFTDLLLETVRDVDRVYSGGQLSFSEVFCPEVLMRGIAPG